MKPRSIDLWRSGLRRGIEGSTRKADSFAVRRKVMMITFRSSLGTDCVAYHGLEGVNTANLLLGDSLILLSEAKVDRQPTPIMLHIYVEDVDAAFERAVKAGGKVVTPLANQFYGDRCGGVIEPSGNTIWIATHVEDVAPAELQRRASVARG